MRGCLAVKSTLIAYMFVLLLLFAPVRQADGMTVKDLPALGSQPTARDINGESVPLYKASYALLISNADYKNGWPTLEHTGKELDGLALVLQKQGFTVRRVTDADSSQLYAVLREFLLNLIKEPDSRAIVFFSGHGYTTKAGMGYLVPVDALDPSKDEDRFRQRALPIIELEVLAKEASSRHVLFILDSCFSGSIFTSKSLNRPDAATEKVSQRQPYFLSAAGRQPVRQFVAAGGAGERLPESSQFIPLLVAVLEGTVTVSRDGYLTGKELGLWLEQTVPDVTGNRTHPHSDVIQDPRYVLGDMVFQLNAPVPAQALVQKATSKSAEARPPASVSAEAIPARTENSKYHTSVTPATADSAISGEYEVTYWREGDDIRAEVAGSVWMPPNYKGDASNEYAICGIQLVIASKNPSGDKWVRVASSETKDYRRTVMRSQPGVPIGPLHFVIKVDSQFDPDDAWLTIVHYSPTKGIFGNLNCDEMYTAMHQETYGLFVPRDIVDKVSRHADTCSMVDALATEFDDKPPLSVKSALTVCYQSPKIFVQLGGAEVKSSSKVPLMLQRLSLQIVPYKDHKWGNPILPVVRSVTFNPPIIVNPGQTVTLPPIDGGEFLITDEARTLITPPSRAIVDVALIVKSINDKALPIESFVPSYTGWLGKLQSGASGF